MAAAGPYATVRGLLRVQALPFTALQVRELSQPAGERRRVTRGRV
jgi:hypothetical protein